jgi:penicillin-binding protein 1C
MWAPLFAAPLFCSVLVYVCLCGITAGLYAAALIPRVRLESPPATPLFEDRQGNYLSEGSGEHDLLGFWDVPASIPDRIRRCILTVEDRRFYEHGGVDVRALFRALYRNLFRGDRQGASTLAMQVARMQRPGRRSLWNKALEMGTALQLVKRFGREAILRHYMKIVPQGNQIHGFAYAARRYFRKPLRDLSWAEASLLASLPRAPEKYNLFRFSGFMSAVDRARMVLGLLSEEGLIDRQVHRSSLAELSRLPMPYREKRPPNSYHFILHLGGLYEAYSQETYTRPVRTTLDPDIQDRLQELATGAMEIYRSYGAGNIAMIVADRRTGDVLGYLGSEDYFDKEFSGSIDYAQTPRSSGSTLKPFLFGLGLESGRFSAASVIADLPLSIVTTTGDYSYRNFDDVFLGPMLYRTALANSRNIPTLRLLEGIGIDETYEFFWNLGFHNREKPASYYGYGMALGGLYVTLENLIKAYGILSNEGRAFSLSWFRGTEEPVRSRFLSEFAARQITLFLSDALARLPTFPRLSSLEFPFPVAVKTGTSQGYRDAWSLAYSSKFVVGVWMGHPDNDRMNNVGSAAATAILKDIMLFLQPQESRGINEEPFPPPRDAAASKICPLSGEAAGDFCPRPVLEYFVPGTEPRSVCRVHIQVAVDRSLGILADEFTSPDQVAIRTYTVLPPEYAVWSVKRGYTLPPARGEHRRPDIRLKIVGPSDGSRLMIDPETPRAFQTFALKAEATPAVPEIIWYVDGEEYKRVPYPYETRWSLTEGDHSFQARFPRANVLSKVISVHVSSF